MFRMDFVRRLVKVKPLALRSMAMPRRLVSHRGRAVSPVLHQADFPPRPVDSDFQIRGLRVFSVSPSRLDWQPAKQPVPGVTQRALLLRSELLLDLPAPVSSTPNHDA